MLKRILLTAAAVLAAAAAPAYAAIDECTVNSSTDIVSISGTADKNGQVLLTVVEKGAAADEFFENTAYQDQLRADADGHFSFEFKMTEAGLYTVYASTPSETYTYDFVFSNAEAADSVIEKINAAGSAAEISALLEENRYAAGLYITEISAEPDYGYIAELMFSSKPYDTDDANSVLALFRQYMIYGYIKDGSASNVFDLDAYLDISSIDGMEIFTDDIFKESHELDATKRISGQSFKNHDEFAKAIAEQSALALIANPNGYGNVQKVCERFDDVIGIDTSDAGSEVYKQLSGKIFDSFDELGKKFEELCKAQQGTPNPGGGGGGGGGGSRPSGGSGGIVSGGNNKPLEEIPVTDTPQNESVFNDLAGYEWARESIDALYELGIVAGRTENTFCPGDNITRSEFVKLVALAFDLSAGTGRLPFEDTSSDSWDYEYIKAAYDSGIVNGISASEFGCGLQITRQDMAVMLRRASEAAPADDASVRRFADDNDISDYAYDDVYALRSAGIINGDESNRFNPSAPATRAEAAKMIYAAMDK